MNSRSQASTREPLFISFCACHHRHRVPSSLFHLSSLSFSSLLWIYRLRPLQTAERFGDSSLADLRFGSIRLCLRVKSWISEERGAMAFNFTGTQQKCKVCDKTVYLMDQLTADGSVFHKSCFKCNHCKGTLTLSTYSSMKGVLYCKPHFEQLFKESGNFNKNFQSPAKSAEKIPELNRSPSKAASMFSGTQEKCATCGKTAYPLEKVTVEGQAYHKSCFKCSHAGCSISPSNYAALEGILYCKHHFSQLFKEKGSYNHLIKSASIKRTAATAPDL